MTRFGMLVVAVASLGVSVAPHAVAAPTPVEPADLTKRQDLIGQEISVDDRVSLFLFHQDRGFDEITLKRTSVLFRLPPQLRYRQSPGAPAARLTGILRKEEGQWVCQVNAVELFPKDLVRLNRGVEVLPPGEFEKRTAWAAWAERRAREFQDEELAQRAREVELDAIRFEAESRSTQPAQLWLKLAKRARTHGLQEPEPSALAHRSFRATFQEAKEVVDLNRLRTDVASFLTESPAPYSTDPAELAKWEEPYQKKPADAYRSAPASVRKALDHRLWADITQRLLERTAEQAPREALKLAERADKELPDRPKVAEQLYQKGLNTETSQLATLRLSEVKTLASVYSERLHRPERGRDLLRSWLEEQRNHQLSPTDAEGRISLANLYENLLDDKATAIDLLQAAWKIDPQSKEIANAFRSRGYRKVNEEWVEPPRAKAASDDSGTGTAQPAPAPQTHRKLTNMTPQQVRALLGGKPNRIVYSGTQGQWVEQWIYFGTKQDQYINFLRTPGTDAPRVIAYYSLPRRAD